MLWAHPRSRGENLQDREHACREHGSSPLTRGKPLRVLQPGDDQGLIPAHAGKTADRAQAQAARRAHPRSRGENTWMFAAPVPVAGSSPLTRGKHGVELRVSCVVGLIPAHAGKTKQRRRTHPLMRAHPRSRGENGSRAGRIAAPMGSSPLTRGKPNRGAEFLVCGGLIPAHAGKTLPDLRFYRADRSDLGKP